MPIAQRFSFVRVRISRACVSASASAHKKDEPMSRSVVLAATVALGFAVVPLRAYAQAPPQTPGAASPAETPSAKPNAGSSDAPLSKKLEEGDGVIKPPHGIDPGMHKDPPVGTGDKMPVIVPPGEPGGDQSVQPK
jgi:hypothetical protein